MGILITGGSGFIGSGLVARLNQEGIVPRLLLRSTSNLEHLAGCQYERIEGSLSDLESLRRAVSGAHSVFHLAASVAGNTAKDFSQTNTDGTALLIRSMLESGQVFERFVYVSTLAAGGPSLTSDPRNEANPDTPVSEYGRSKKNAETAILAYRDRIPMVILRPPMVYGPRDRATLLFAKAAQKRWVPLPRTGGLSITKTYSQIHVDDLVDALVCVLKKNIDRSKSGQFYYVSGEEIIRDRDIYTAYGRALGIEPKFFLLPTSFITPTAWILNTIGKLRGKAFPLNSDKMNEILPNHWTCSSELFRSEFSFRPSRSYEVGVKGTVKWYLEKGWL